MHGSDHAADAAETLLRAALGEGIGARDES